MPTQPMRDPNPYGAFAPAQGLSDAGHALASGSPDAVRSFAQEVQGWSKGAADMKASAMSGGFAIDPAAGQAYVNAYNFALGELDKIRGKVWYITQTYKLGTTPGAKLIAPWNQQVGQEFSAVLGQLGDVYTNARDAYAQAIRNYREGEQSVSDALWKSGGHA